jgi:hypothetical protein
LPARPRETWKRLGLSASLGELVAAVCGKVAIMIDAARWPGDIDRIDLLRLAQAEMEPVIGC